MYLGQLLRMRQKSSLEQLASSVVYISYIFAICIMQISLCVVLLIGSVSEGHQNDILFKFLSA